MVITGASGVEGGVSMVRRLLFVTAASLFLCMTAQAEEKEPVAIIELGVAGEWSLPGTSSFGPSAAIEFEPIKEWLEIEIGAAHC